MYTKEDMDKVLDLANELRVELIDYKACLQFIADNGGVDEVDEETGELICCSGFWCGEQANSILIKYKEKKCGMA